MPLSIREGDTVGGVGGSDVEYCVCIREVDTVGGVGGSNVECCVSVSGRVTQRVLGRCNVEACVCIREVDTVGGVGGPNVESCVCIREGDTEWPKEKWQEFIARQVASRSKENEQLRQAMLGFIHTLEEVSPTFYMFVCVCVCAVFCNW